MIINILNINIMKTKINKHKTKMILFESKSIILTFISMFFLLSCSNDNTFTPQNITPILIGKGIHSGSATQSNIVITNDLDWQQLMNLLTTENTNNFSETNIDFNKFQLIVSIDSVRPDTGYSISISNIIENSNNILVTVSSVNNGNGFTVFSQPFEIVKIPKSTKPVVFQ